MVTLDEQTKENKMMTRKQFVAFAKAISNRPDAELRKQLAMDILPTLQASNPRFNTAKFLAACNVVV